VVRYRGDDQDGREVIGVSEDAMPVRSGPCADCKIDLKRIQDWPDTTTFGPKPSSH
jgi:hypothetical protein